MAVVIPVFNEERSLPLVLADLPFELVERVVVCDNGSTDCSFEAATRDVPPERRRKIEVVREARQGYGSASLRALAHLRETGPPDIVVFLDGDYSDHPEELSALLAPIESGRADFVVGSRRLGVAEKGALLPQARFGNALAVFLIRALTGAEYTDLGPFRAIRWDALERLAMGDVDFGWTCEMQMKAIGVRLRIAEVPVSYRRRVGVSKIAGTFTGSIRAGGKILWRVFRHARVARASQVSSSSRPP